MSQLNPLNIIIVERLGELKTLNVKDFKEEELYKKCGFKKAEDFVKQHEWTVKIDSKKYFIRLYAKSEGRANSENKYDFPPPVDNKLFFGSCTLVAQIYGPTGGKVYTDLPITLWNKIYEKLFGGFEDLASTAKEDEEEEDELANVPKSKKTKHGYLKDGFVVDSSETDDETYAEDTEDEDTDYTEVCDDDDDNEDGENEGLGPNAIDVDGLELTEESYDYSSESD